MSDQTPAPQKPVSVDAAAVHYGVQINLPARMAFYIAQQRTPADFKADVLVCFGNEAKTFTFEEFLLLLGFTSTESKVVPMPPAAKTG